MNTPDGVSSFCAGLGLGRIEFPFVLAFDRSGQIAMEERDARLCISLVRRVPPGQVGLAEAALRAVRPGRGLPWMIRPGFRGTDQLVLRSTIPVDRADQPAIEQAIRSLFRVADEIEAAQ